MGTSVKGHENLRNKKQSERFGEAIPTNLLKTKGRSDLLQTSELRVEIKISM